MPSKAIWLVLLAGISLQMTGLLRSSVNDSASLRGNGTDGVTLWQDAFGSQPYTSEPGHRPALAVGVTPLSNPTAKMSSVALESAWTSDEVWQPVVTCVGMTAFALFIIRRRVRRAHGSGRGSPHSGRRD